MMALPTTEHHAPAQQQHQSPGVGMQGAAPVAPSTEPVKPVLFDDIDPVLLIRLYPGAKDAAELRAQAMAQGIKTAEEGAANVAAQQQPVVILGEPPPPPRSGPGPHREA
jgi:hypothetical protein